MIATVPKFSQRRVWSSKIDDVNGVQSEEWVAWILSGLEMRMAKVGCWSSLTYLKGVNVWLLKCYSLLLKAITWMLGIRLTSIWKCSVHVAIVKINPFYQVLTLNWEFSLLPSGFGSSSMNFLFLSMDLVAHGPKKGWKGKKGVEHRALSIWK